VASTDDFIDGSAITVSSSDEIADGGLLDECSYGGRGKRRA